MTEFPIDGTKRKSRAILTEDRSQWKCFCKDIAHFFLIGI